MTQLTQSRMNSLVSRSGDVVRMPVISTQRGGHGGTAWSTPFGEQVMIQPQDGAVDTRTKLANIRSHQHSDGLHEAEDARLTGGTRSLNRRLLGLNVLEPQRKSVVSEVAVARVEVA
jgi:hypothetical protein